jgi:hypothetical protein
MGGVVIADYGVGNIFSVFHAFEAVGAVPAVTKDPAKVRNADRLVIPGVGDFANCMERFGLCGNGAAVVGYLRWDANVVRLERREWANPRSGVVVRNGGTYPGRRVGWCAVKVSQYRLV